MMKPTESEIIAAVSKNTDLSHQCLFGCHPPDATGAIAHLGRAIEWLRALEDEQKVERLRVHSQLNTAGGISAGKQWLGRL